MVIANDQLKSLLIGAELLTEADWNAVLKNAERRRRSVIDIVLERNIIDEGYLYEMIAEFLKIPFVDFKKIVVDVAVARTLPEDIMTTYHAIPFQAIDKKTVAVAFTDPTDTAGIKAVEESLGKKIKTSLTTKRSFLFGLRSCHRDIREELDEILGVARAPQGGATGLSLEGEYPVVKIVDTILAYSVLLGASDVHFEPLSDAFLIRMRIDGLLHDQLELPKGVLQSVVARIKILAHLKIDEHMAPQDGRFIFLADGDDVFVRVSIIPTFFGEKIVMRILNEHDQRFNLEESGMNAYNLEIVEREAQRSHGLVLVVGPTGSGKTTTLYTLLNMLNTEEANICTIEDPIEYGIPRINQTQVNVASGYTFASGLRALLRQDPDVIMVGEIRDDTTAEIAIHSSLTGHQVVSTLHTDDTISVIPRLIDMAIKPFVLASTLSMVIAQRLVRRICLDCIESYHLEKAYVESLVADYHLDRVFLVAKKRGILGKDIKDLKDLTFYQGKGCARCHMSGYSGRVGIFEVLTLNEVLRGAIAGGANPDELEHIAVEQGMRTLVDDGWEKVLTGQTSLAELLAIIGG